MADDDKCCNAAVCGDGQFGPGTGWGASLKHDFGRDWCSQCDYLKFGRIPRRPPEGGDEPCPVCMEDVSLLYRMPMCNHYLCAGCMQDLLFGKEEQQYHLNPTRFGAPACPNGCNNPQRGAQCVCEEHEALMEEWYKAHPVQAKVYSLLEDDSIMLGAGPESSLRSGRCPICRAKWKDPSVVE